MATLNMRLSQPSILIDLNGISGLDGIALRDGNVEIGAMVRQAAAAKSDVIAKHAPLIAMAMPHIAHPGDPQSRHHRRLDRLRRSGRGIAGLLFSRSAAKPRSRGRTASAA